MYWHEGPVNGPVNWTAYLRARAGVGTGVLQPGAERRPAWVHVPEEAAESPSLRRALAGRPAAELDRILLNPLWPADPEHGLPLAGRLVTYVGAAAGILPSGSARDVPRKVGGAMAVPVDASNLEAATGSDATSVRLLPPHLAADRETFTRALERIGPGAPGSPPERLARLTELLASAAGVRAEWPAPSPAEDDPARRPARGAGTWQALAVRLAWWGRTGTALDWTALRRQVTPMAAVEFHAMLDAPAVPLHAARALDRLSAEPGAGLLLWTGDGLDERFRGALVAGPDGRLFLVDPSAGDEPLRPASRQSLSWLGGSDVRGTLLDAHGHPTPWTDIVRMDALLDPATALGTDLSGPVGVEALSAMPVGSITAVSAGETVLVERLTAETFRMVETTPDGERQVHTFALSGSVPLPDRIALPAVGEQRQVVALDPISRRPVVGERLPDEAAQAPDEPPLASWKGPRLAAAEIGPGSRTALLALLPGAVRQAVRQLTGASVVNEEGTSRYVISTPAHDAGRPTTIDLEIRLADQQTLGEDTLRVRRSPGGSFVMLVSELAAPPVTAGGTVDEQAASRVSWTLARGFLGLLARLGTPAGTLPPSDVAALHELAVFGSWLAGSVPEAIDPAAARDFVSLIDDAGWWPHQDGSAERRAEITRYLAGSWLTPEARAAAGAMLDRAGDADWVLRHLARAGQGLSHLPMRVQVALIRAQTRAELAAQGVGAAELAAPAPAPPVRQPAAPAYREYGALGDLEVVHPPEVDDEEARRLVDAVVDRLPRMPDGTAVPAEIREAIRDRLLALFRGADPGADPAGEHAREKWERSFFTGIVADAGGRVLWLRPVLGSSQRIDHPGTDIRRYGVTFGGPSTAVSSTVQHGGTYLESVHSSSSVSTSVNTAAIGGHRLFVTGLTYFTNDLGFEIYLDGSADGTPWAAIPSGATMTTGWPSVLSHAGPRPAERTGSTAHPDATAEQHSASSRVVANAVNPVPLAARWLAELRKRANAKIAAAVFAEGVRQLVNESTLRQRHAVLDGDGEQTDVITARDGRTSFQGYLTLRQAVVDLEMVDITDQVSTRMDRGVATTRNITESGATGFSLGKLWSLPIRTGVTAGRDRSSALGAAETLQNHTVIVEVAPHARYRASIRLTLTTRSGTDVAPVTVTVTGEHSVALRDAANLERELFGRVFSPELGALGVAPVRAVLPAPVARPDYRLAQPMPAPVTGDPASRPPRDAVYWRPGAGFSRPLATPAPPGTKLIIESRTAPQHRAWADRGRTPESIFQEHYGVAPYTVGLPAPQPGESASMVRRLGADHLQALVLVRAGIVAESIKRVLAGFDSIGAEALSESGEIIDWGKVPLPDGEPELGAEGRRRVVHRAGKSTMEGDFDRIQVGRMSGISVRTRPDARKAEPYRILVLTRIGDHLGTDQYRLTVNSRNVGSLTSSGSRSTSTSVAVPVSTGVGIPFTSLGVNVTVSGDYGWSHSQSLSFANQQYHRTETDGDVVDHRYGTETVVAVFRPRDGRFVSWTLDFTNNGTFARLVTPKEYVPTAEDGALRTLTPGELRQAQWLTLSERRWRSETYLPLDQAGVDGIVAKFSPMRDLVRHGADGLGLPTGTLRDAMTWPEELFDLMSPETWSQVFGSLTGVNGYPATMTLPGGRTATVTLHLRVTGLRRRPGTAEVEQYRRAEAGHSANRSQSLSLRGKGRAKIADGVVAPRGSVGGGYSWTEGDGDGAVDIGRATYPDGVQYEADVELAMTFAVDGRSSTAHFRGLGVGNLLITDDKMRDLLSHFPYLDSFVTKAVEAPEPPEPITDYRDMARVVESPAAEGTVARYLARTAAPQLRAFDRLIDKSTVNALIRREWSRRQEAAGASRQLIDPILRNALYAQSVMLPELLDGVLEGARKLGVLPAGKPEHLLRQALLASYAPEKVTNQYRPLVGHGILRLYPVNSPLLGTSYLAVWVDGRTGEEASSDLPRDGVGLTLRRQAAGSASQASGWKLSRGGGLSVAASRALPFFVSPVAEAVDLGYGVTRSTDNTLQMSTERSTKDIFRIAPKKSHELHFAAEARVRMGVLRELPEPLQSLKSLATETGSAIAWLAGFGAAADDAGKWADIFHRIPEDQKLSWTLAGDARLLAPLAITEEKNRPGAWVHHAGAAVAGWVPPGVLRATWEPRGATPDLEASELNRELLHELSTNQPLFPWTLQPIADAIQRYLELAMRYGPGGSPDVVPRESTAHAPAIGDPSGFRAGAWHLHTAEGRIATQLDQLLGGWYRVPDSKVQIGFRLWRAEVHQKADGSTRTERIKGRRYRQATRKVGVKDKGTTSIGHSVDWNVRTRLGDVGDQPSRSSKVDTGGSMSSKATRERNAERVGQLEHFRYDLSAYLRGPFGTIRLDLSRGMWISRAADRTPPPARPLLPLSVTETPGDGLLDGARPADSERAGSLVAEAQSIVDAMSGRQPAFELRIEATGDVPDKTAAQLVAGPDAADGRRRFVLRVWDQLSPAGLRRAVSQATGALVHAAGLPGWTAPAGMSDVLRAGSAVPLEPVLSPHDVGWLHHLRAMANDFVAAAADERPGLLRQAVVVHRRLGLAAGMPDADARVAAVLDFLHDTPLFADGDRMAFVHLSENVDDAIAAVPGWEDLLAGPEEVVTFSFGRDGTAREVSRIAERLVQLGYQRLLTDRPLPRTVLTLPGRTETELRTYRDTITDLLRPALVRLLGDAPPITADQLMPETRIGPGRSPRFSVRTDMTTPWKPVRWQAGRPAALALTSELTTAELAGHGLPERLAPRLRDLADAVVTSALEASARTVRVDLTVSRAETAAATPDDLSRAGASARSVLERLVREVDPSLSVVTRVTVVDGPATDLSRVAGRAVAALLTAHVMLPPGAVRPPNAVAEPVRSAAHVAERWRDADDRAGSAGPTTVRSVDGDDVWHADEHVVDLPVVAEDQRADWRPIAVAVFDQLATSAVVRHGLRLALPRIAISASKGVGRATATELRTMLTDAVRRAAERIRPELDGAALAGEMWDAKDLDPASPAASIRITLTDLSLPRAHGPSTVAPPIGDVTWATFPHGVEPVRDLDDRVAELSSEGRAALRFEPEPGRPVQVLFRRLRLETAQEARVAGHLRDAVQAMNYTYRNAYGEQVHFVLEPASGEAGHDDALRIPGSLLSRPDQEIRTTLTYHLFNLFSTAAGDEIHGERLRSIAAAAKVWHELGGSGVPPVVAARFLASLPESEAAHPPPGEDPPADGPVRRIGNTDDDLHRQVLAAADRPTIFLDTPAGFAASPEHAQTLDRLLSETPGALVVTAAAAQDLVGLVHRRRGTLLIRDAGRGWRVSEPGRVGPVLGGDRLTRFVVDLATVAERLPDGVVRVAEDVHRGFFAFADWWRSVDPSTAALVRNAATAAAATGANHRVLVIGDPPTGEVHAVAGRTDIPRNQAFGTAWQQAAAVHRVATSLAAEDAATRPGFAGDGRPAGRRPEVLMLAESGELAALVEQRGLTVISRTRRTANGRKPDGVVELGWRWEVSHPSAAGERPAFDGLTVAFAESARVNRAFGDAWTPEPITALTRAGTIAEKLAVAEHYGADLRTPEVLDRLGNLTGFHEPAQFLATLRRWVAATPETITSSRNPADFTVPAAEDDARRQLSAVYAYLRWSAAEAGRPPADQHRHPLHSDDRYQHPPLSKPIGAAALRNYLRHDTGDQNAKHRWDWLLTRALHRPGAADGVALTPLEAAALATGVAHSPRAWANAMVFVAIAAYDQLPALGLPLTQLDAMLDRLINGVLCDLTPPDRLQWYSRRHAVTEQLAVRSPHAAELAESRIRTSIGCPVEPAAQPQEAS